MKSIFWTHSMPKVLQMILAISTTICTANSTKIDVAGDTKSLRLSSWSRVITKNEEAPLINNEATIKADSTTSTANWNLAFSTASGLFKRGTDYAVAFEYQNIKLGPGAFIRCIIRDLKGSAPDLAAANLTGEGGVRTQELAFSVPAVDSYSLQVYVFKQGLAYIGNIRLTEGGFLKKLPAVSSKEPYTRALPPVPTGPAEFSVLLPTATSTCSVADFGGSPANADNLAAFQKAINHCRANRIGKLVVPTGKYYFVNDYQSLRFKGLTNFTFDGQDSEFIFYRPHGSPPLWLIEDCEQVLLTRFVLDWENRIEPIASLVEVDAVAPDGAYIDVVFVDYEKVPFREFVAGYMAALDPKKRVPGVEGAADYMADNSDITSRKEWLSDNKVRLYMNVPAAAKRVFTAGEMRQLRHYNFEMCGFTMANDSHLTFRNVTIYSCPGYGYFVNGDLDHLWLLGCTNTLRPGSKQCITSGADAFHVNISQGYIKMEQCDFGYSGDDCINIHDTSFSGTVTGEDTLLQSGNGRYWTPPITVGDPIEFINEDLSPTGFTAKVTQITGGSNPAERTLTFADPFPAKVSGFVVCYNRRFNSGNIIIRDSYFHENRGAGYRLQSANVLLEGNRFYHNSMPALRIESGYSLTSWSEGTGAANVVIRNNVFEDCNTYRFEDHAPTLHMGTYLEATRGGEKTAYPVFSDILIENNSIVNSVGAAMTVCSARNIVIRNNTFVDTLSRGYDDPWRGTIFVSSAAGITIINNTWEKSHYVPSPGLIYEEDSCGRILFEGNVVK